MSTSRRDFLKTTVKGSALLSLAPAVPAFLTDTARAAESASDGRDTVLVVVQLSGGNDGLNTIVPYTDDEYARNRTTLRLTEREVHKVDSYWGFHPHMKAAARLFKEGRLSVVQGVGYEKSDRNHPTAMRNWHTARPDDPNCNTGWMGRAVDHVCQNGETGMPGVFVGPIARPLGINAENAVVPSIRKAEELTFRAPPTIGDAVAADHANEDPLARFVRRNAIAAQATSRDVKAVLADAGATADYPAFPLAGLLKTIAQLMRSDVGIRIFFTELGGGGIGGFDNHANQRDNHAALLGQLSESIAAFVDDLARDGQLKRMLLMTFSEFGRTLAENGRRGTGHGAAQPVLLAGGGLKGGLIGKHPDLTSLDQGAPKHDTDFRRLYAAALGWLGIDSQAVLGRRYKPLDALKT